MFVYDRIKSARGRDLCISQYKSIIETWHVQFLIFPYPKRNTTIC